MQAIKIVTSILSALIWLADRDARKAAAAQVKYKRQHSQRAMLLAREQARLRQKATALSDKTNLATSRAALGSNKFNEQERAARTLAIKLKSLME